MLCQVPLTDILADGVTEYIIIEVAQKDNLYILWVGFPPRHI